MQAHPGFYFYQYLHDNGRIRFPFIDPVCDCPSSHLSCYITASYLLIYELARELTRARIALAAARNRNPPPTVGFTPFVPPASVTPATPVTTQGTTNPLAVTPRSAPAAWASLVATPAAPMLQTHPAPAPEGESSRQHRRVSLTRRSLLSVQDLGPAQERSPQQHHPSSTSLEYHRSHEYDVWM